MSIGGLGRWMKRASLSLLVAMAFVATGCETDSFMDPSVVGRWENTPVVLPILERLDVIDEPLHEIAGVSQIRSEDLIPTVSEYVLGAGDLITVTVFELITPGVETVQTRRIDEVGYIRLPVVGQIKAAGLTTKQLEQRIIDILDPAILKNPMVTVVVQEGRQRTFHVLGTAGAGTYSIVQPNFRLLEALALARGLPPRVDKLYIIRQVSLSEQYNKGFTPDVSEPGAAQPPLRKTGPDTGGGTSPAPGGAVDPGKLIDNLTKSLDEPKDKETKEPKDAPAPKPEAPKAAPQLNDALEPSGATSDARYINIDGKWVLVKSQATPAAKPAPEPGAAPAKPGAADETLTSEQLVTQRVIEIDAEALIAGEAKYNLVVRPGDVIRIPEQDAGNVYIGGSISRGGTYALPGTRQLTLKQLVISAGGLNPVAIPERVDLVRRLGKDQEAMVRLNLRAIFDGSEPDIFLKPDDTINVGTNGFANFAAVIRNSFRMSYGFGFLMDRNFGQDVLGLEKGLNGR
jgi:polysaccharide export outer membrane protein